MNTNCCGTCENESQKSSGCYIAYDFLCKGVAENRYPSPYIGQFTEIGALKEYRKLKKWRSFLNGPTLKKEVTECMAAVNSLLKIMEEIRPTLEAAKTIIVFDVCSGKGYTSVILQALLPEEYRSKTKIIMLDRNTKMNMKHLESFPNGEVSFQRFCIYTEEKNGRQRLIQDLTERISAFGTPGEEVVAISMGIHLCVYLSELFIEAFNEIDSIVATVLSPCCYKENPHNTMMFEMCRSSIFEDDDFMKLKEASKYTIVEMHYMIWTVYLYGKIQGCRKKMIHDLDVLSPRNNFIVACKQRNLI